MPYSVEQAIATARTVLQGHNALAEAAGYEGDQEIHLDIAGSGDGGEVLRSLLSEAFHYTQENLSTFDIIHADREEDGTFSENTKRKWAARIYTMRCLLGMARGTDSFEKTATFRCRNFQDADAAVMLERGIRKDLLGSTMCTFQYRVEESDTYPLVISWAILVDGNPISKGTRQPIQRFMSSIFRPMQAPDVLESPRMQEILREIANSVPTKKSWYFYLSNQNTADHYKQFQQWNNTQSCMSYVDTEYGHTGEGQHPMQCYDNSPDWSLLLISEYSPEDMEAMLAEAEADSDKFKYPFATRCMVLPKSKLMVGKRTNALKGKHFVFGKIYGHDQITHYFHSSDTNNPLMKQIDSIYGGRIPAIRSTAPHAESEFLLPYFDKANRAILQKDGEDFWWISGSEEHLDRISSDYPDTTIIGIAACVYQQGTAKFSRMKEQFSGTWHLSRTCKLTEGRVHTGIEYGSILDNNFARIELEGELVYIPRSLVYTWAGNAYLTSQCAWATSHQQFVPIAELERMDGIVNHPTFGWVSEDTVNQLEAAC